MPIKILMPALSPTMTEGTLASWQKKEGDEVTAGDVIAEIETDKATMEVEAVDEGVMGRILIPEGTEGVPVNEVIALLLEEGEDAAALDSASAAAPAAAPATNGSAASAGNGAAAPAAAPAPAPAPAPAQAAAPSGGRVFASPLARRLAADAGLDLSKITGSGPNGRVVKADVLAAQAGGGARAEAAPAAPRPAAPIAPGAGPDAGQLAEAYGIPFTEVPNNNIRKVVARRLTEAKQTIPHFYLTIDAEIDALLAARKQINDAAPEGVKVSVNDIVIKAAALALKKVPAANASWGESAILLYDRVDIAVAVATDNGLITPIIKDADNKGLGQISSEMKDLAGRARQGKLKPEEFQGGTFSISNLGMFGIKAFDAVINPPHGCILAVGAGSQQPVVRNGELAVATVMSSTLSVDHRVVDGAVGAEFLAAYKIIIENPASMLL